VDSVAKQSGCPAALIVELTGHLIGRIRERDEQILKSQPII
jgi:hypothetical protein